ncbi:MAG: hypothetical protein ABSE70_05015 [Candidatus Limnocylindrales bacterium]
MDNIPERLDRERRKTQAKRDSAAARMAKVVSDFDPVPLCAALAALTIRPENADFQFRLESMINLAASNPCEGRPALTVEKIRSLCTGSLSAKLVAPLEDPAEYPVTQVLVFDDHAYTVFSGQEFELVFSCERLFASIADLAADRTDLDLQSAINLIRGVLVLSEAVTKRAGANPDMPARHQRQLFVPDIALDELVRPAQWSRAEIAELLTKTGLPVDVLDPIYPPMGRPLDEPFPALLTSGDAVVVRPGRLLFGASRAVLHIVEAGGLLPLVAERFGQEVQAEIFEAILGMGGRPMPLPMVPPGQPEMSEAMFALDHDAVMLVLTVTDQIDQLDLPNREPRVFPSDSQKAALLSRFGEVVAQLREESSDRRILFCVCSAILPGASYWLHDFPFGGDAELLFLTPEALRVIAHHERDPLALLRFAEAQRRFHASSPVVFWNSLDEFAVYREHGHSFHLTEESASPAVSIHPGMGLRLRQEMLDALERQSAHAPTGAGEMELLRTSYRGVPIFAPRISRGQATRVVRLPGLDIWVAGEPYEDLPGGLTEFSEGLIDTAAYWVWQAASAIVEDPECQDGSLLTVAIGIGLDSPADWRFDPMPPVTSEDAIFAELDDKRSAMTLWLPPGLLRSMVSPDNEGERHLARAITGSLLELLAPGEGQHGRLDDIVEQIAPVGPRKMMLVYDDNTASMLGPGDGLPEWRKLSQWDLGQIRDEIADAFRAAGFVPGPAGTRAEQNALLNFAVEFCYRRLEAEVAELAPSGLLEDLLRRNEASLLASARRKLLVVTRPACFGHGDEVLEPLVREELEWSDADASHRFLVEYVAARPPSGLRALTLSRYDRLIALAYSIIQYGMQSDITKNEIDDVQARVAPSGRLQMSPGKYGPAVVRWLSGITGRRLESAQDQFAEHWEPPHEGPVQAEADYEEAFLAEYDFSATHLGDVFYVLRDLAADGQASLAARPRAAVMDECSRMRVVPAKVADVILAALTLEPRTDFLKPPAPFSPLDVYPWRFSRELSLLARPLVRRGEDLVWGRRAVNLSAFYLLQQLATGRLKANSKLMQNLRSDISTASGKDFEAEVADRVRELGLPVKPHATKVSGIRISVEKGTLGDVDVLAADAGARVIWAIECKAFAMARTPWEIRNELLKFIDPHTGVAAHHAQRVKWLRAHMAETLREFGIDDPGGWRIEPLVVLEVDLLAAHLHNSPIAIIDLPGLAGVLRPGRPLLTPTKPSGLAPSDSPPRERGSDRA